MSTAFGVQDVQSGALNPFWRHRCVVKELCNCFRARGVTVKKVMPVSMRQIRTVNAVTPGSLRELQVRPDLRLYQQRLPHVPCVTVSKARRPGQVVCGQSSSSR